MLRTLMLTLALAAIPSLAMADQINLRCFDDEAQYERIGAENPRLHIDYMIALDHNLILRRSVGKNGQEEIQKAPIVRFDNREIVGRLSTDPDLTFRIDRYESLVQIQLDDAPFGEPETCTVRQAAF